MPTIELEIVYILIGVYLVTFALLVNTSNLKSFVVFRFIPFFSGLFMIIVNTINMLYVV